MEEVGPKVDPLRTVGQPGIRPGPMSPTSQRRGGRDPTFHVMEATAGWGRIWVAARRSAGWDKLRQGAWYPVVSTGATRTVLSVSGSPLALPKDAVEVRSKQPTRFTVVYRLPDAPNPARGTTQDLGKVYAVCPACTARVKLGPVPPVTATCRTCGHEDVVAWWETG